MCRAQWTPPAGRAGPPGVTRVPGTGTATPPRARPSRASGPAGGSCSQDAANSPETLRPPPPSGTPTVCPVSRFFSFLKLYFKKKKKARSSLCFSRFPNDGIVKAA